MFSLDLDMLKGIKRPFAIQVQRKGRSRAALPTESRDMIVGALNALDRSSGGRVKTLNAEIDGKPIALAFIENAQFEEDTDGNTVLDGPEE
jgi:hypothetical protein